MADETRRAHAPELGERQQQGAFDRMLATARPPALHLAGRARRGRSWPWADLLVGSADPGPVTTAVVLDTPPGAWGRND